MELAMHQNWPESADPLSLTLLKIARMQELFKSVIEVCASEYQLQHSDFSVLAALRRSPKPYCLSPTLLYKSMFFSSGGLTKVLTRLVSANLIERIDNPLDKRGKLVKLSKKGKLLVETILPKIHDKNKILLKGLSKEEQLTLENLLQQALDNYESM